MKEIYRKRLKQLCDYLLTVDPKKFSMIYYVSDINRPDYYPSVRLAKSMLENNECGTSGCSLGHAAVLFDDTIHLYLAWEKIALHLFCIHSNSIEWTFLFGGVWSEIDDSPKFAAQRISYFLKNGISEYKNIVLKVNSNDFYVKMDEFVEKIKMECAKC